MGTVQTPFGAVEVSDVESAGRFSVGDKVAFTFDGTELGYATSAEGIVQRITKSGRSTRLTIDIGHGMTVLRHASDVEPVTGWQERVDPAIAAAVGDGSGPLPIRTHPDSPAGPAVTVHWLHGSVLVVGIYTTERQGTVYRWDKGLDQPPMVINWDLDGPECK